MTTPIMTTSTTTTPIVTLRQATLDDISALLNLLNLCYRDDVGWTNESELIGGIRTTEAELQKVVDDKRHYLFVYPERIDSIETGKILGSIAVQIQTEINTAYIGMFAVHPDLQGLGVGNTMLEAVETFANRHLKSDNANKPIRLTMSILSHRPELLAYYQRRGYALTGASLPFPDDGNNGEPKRSDLELLELEKWV